jgi:hypothetical protein
MSWTVQTLQDQVQLLTGHDGLASEVMTWANRVMMELAHKAYWPRQLKNVDLGSPVQSATVASQWINNTAFWSLDIMGIHRVNYGTNGVLTRHAVQDFYGFFHGADANYITGAFERYCVPKWTSGSQTSNYYMWPLIAVHPIYNTSTNSIQVNYLQAPAKFTLATDYNWILTKYPQVVLAGVLRYAFLFIGDGNRYSIFKGKYINGIADMVRNETASLASTPALRGQYPEQIMRGGV